MPYYPGGGGSANLSGTATQLDVSGSGLTASVDVNNTMILIGQGGAPIQSASVFVDYAQVINFTGSAVQGASLTAGTCSITMSGGGSQGPAGPTGAQGPVSSTSGSTWGALQYATGTTTSSLYGALSASIDPSGNLVIWATSGSAYPPTPGPQKGQSGITFFVRDRVGRNVIGVLPTSGADYWLQPHIGRDKIATWNPPGNATTAPGVNGFAAIVATGTATANNVAATPFSATLRRIGYAGAATAGNGGGICGGVAQWFRGSEVGSGGFYMITRGCIDLNTVAANMATFFCGMSASIVDTGAALAANTSITGTMINAVGVMKASGSNNYAFCWNGGGGIASQSDTGIPMANGNAFEIHVYAPAGGNYCGVQLQIMQSSSQNAAFVITNSNLPVNTTMLNPHVWVGNGATAAAVSVAVSHIYISSDN